MKMDTSVKIILVKYMELEQVFFFWIENNSTIFLLIGQCTPCFIMCRGEGRLFEFCREKVL